MPGNPSWREKWPDRDVYHGCPPGAEVKIDWSHAFTSPYAFMAWTNLHLPLTSRTVTGR